MNYYPLNLDIRQRSCVVVGGGAVALRKITSLLACEANVTLVSPQIEPALHRLAEAGRITWHPRRYLPADLAGAYLVIAATDQPQVNRAVAEEARRRHLLCNVIDQPQAGNFILPSAVRRGDLLLTVSTAGQSPALARHLRKELEARFGSEYEVFLRLTGAVRRRLMARGSDSRTQRETLEQMVAADLFQAVAEGCWPEIRRRLRAILGDAYDEELLAVAGAPQNGAAPQPE